MGKTKAKTKTKVSPDFTLPRAPFIYINDPTTGGLIASKLAELIPKTIHVTVGKHSSASAGRLTKEHSKVRDTVFIWSSDLSKDDDAAKKIMAALVREAAIIQARNSATINIHLDENGTVTTWGANHLDLVVSGGPDTVSASEVDTKAKAIYKWLFTVFTVKETLHLIPDEQMRILDSSTAFKDAEYCTILDHKKVSKDAKIQFVAVIVTKPSIIGGNKLIWQVADKTGVANFYFKWRGPSSQHTWDWVLKLEPGQRKCLPRMPCVLVKEKFHISLLKAPIRVPGAVVQETGQIIKHVGNGLIKVGKAMKMGKRKRWVPQADVTAYLKKHDEFKIVPCVKKETIPIFTEKGHRAWSDNDSTRSTLKDVVVNEKTDLVATKEASLES